MTDLKEIQPDMMAPPILAFCVRIKGEYRALTVMLKQTSRRILIPISNPVLTGPDKIEKTKS